MVDYLHGYSTPESLRLVEQANLFEALVHEGTIFADGARVLEAGCGVGAQTVNLARRSPGAMLTCVDISEPSLETARTRIAETGIQNVTFRHADLLHLPFDDSSFDEVFVCLVLEHCGDPTAALKELRRVLCPGGRITAFENDHGTTAFYPITRPTRDVYDAMIHTQAAMGGDGKIGHKLFPLLRGAGFHVDCVEPRTLYLDARSPNLVQSIIGNLLVPVLKTARSDMVKHSGLDAAYIDRGIDEWQAISSDPGFVFSVTFFKAMARTMEQP
jgi:SAM-dependent methyltransferase